MIVFQSLKAAQLEGFRWLCFDASVGLHQVELDRRRADGRRERAIAFALPDADE